MSDTKKENKIKTELLLRHKDFAGYQQDFLRVVLKEPEYTLTEAKKIAKAFFGKEK